MSDKHYMHHNKRNQLINDIKKLSQFQEKITLQKKTSNLFRHRPQKIHKIDVRAFNQVLSVDQTALTAEVEGMTTYEDLVNATLKYGCLPAVVPELKTITVGGALAGVGIESSSFRYGLVHETIPQFEVLLPDGTMVSCQPNNVHRDLYYSFPNSYGTLGYALKVTVKLVPAKKYIQLHYQHFTNPEDFFTKLNQVCTENKENGHISYVDGVVFDKNHLVLITAMFVDSVPFVSNYKFMKIFYRSLKKKTMDYLTAEDYIWRWDTDWFWCSKVFYMQNPLLRFLIGKWVLHSKIYSKFMRFSKRNPVMRWWLKTFEANKESVIQDVAIPIKNALDYFHFFQENIGITPFWICPVRPKAGHLYDLFKMDSSTLYVNFGFWDIIPSTQKEGYYNRLIEHKVRALEGNKSLYSNVFYTVKEFWEIYDKERYLALKNKYDPQNTLDTIYHKCVEKM